MLAVQVLCLLIILIFSHNTSMRVILIQLGILTILIAIFIGMMHFLVQQWGSPFDRAQLIRENIVPAALWSCASADLAASDRTYTSSDGSISFAYPAGWQATELVHTAQVELRGPHTDQLAVDTHGEVTDVVTVQRYVDLAALPTDGQLPEQYTIVTDYIIHEKGVEDVTVMKHQSQGDIYTYVSHDLNTTIHSYVIRDDGAVFLVETTKVANSGCDNLAVFEQVVLSLDGTSNQDDFFWSEEYFCTTAPVSTAIGQAYPINRNKYPSGYLGQLFTAADCSSERMQAVFGVDDGQYRLQPQIVLYDEPSTELLSVLEDIGFVPGAACLAGPASQCRGWSLPQTVPLTEILKLKPYGQLIQSSGCLNCG